MDPNSTPFRGAKVDAAGARSNMLFAPAIVVAVTSLNKGALGLTLGLTSAAALTLGAWLMRDGLRAAAAYEERRAARRPAIPRKLFSAVITSLAWHSPPFAMMGKSWLPRFTEPVQVS